MTAGAGQGDSRGQDHPVQLPWYASGALDAGERRLIEAHLKTCAICRQEVDALESMRDTLRRHAGADHVEVADLVAMEEEPAGADAGRAESVRRHVASCRDCLEELETLRAARRGFEATDITGGKERIASGPRAAANGWTWAFLATAAAAIGLALPLLRDLRPQGDGLQPQAIQAVKMMPASRDEGPGAELTGTGPWVVEVVLPFGAPAGVYEVHIAGITPARGADVGLRATATTDGTLTLLLPPFAADGPYRLEATPVSKAGTAYEYLFTARRR